ncbi:unnamed protein product, partial [Ectocarpus sp. 13 AM-2016]
QLSCRPSYPTTCTASHTLADTARRATTQCSFGFGLAPLFVLTSFRNKRQGLALLRESGEGRDTAASTVLARQALAATHRVWWTTCNLQWPCHRGHGRDAHGLGRCFLNARDLVNNAD